MTEQQVLARLTAECAKAEHCMGEMLEKMRRWGIDDDVQARVMAYLIKGKYVDDERFCRLFVRDKIRFNGWGRRKVEQALYQKRIDKVVSGPILDAIDDSEYINVLRPLIRSKRKSIKAANEYERNQKLMKFALSRGFEWNIIRQCIDGAEIEDYD
ncbi:MAG: regulatory protein RecX [Hoylesella enoeca]|uniref:regulatory protein RecX n=1 Tax=Hoylesella enoeca TaxID=76123 RepID=UPI003F9FC456